MSSLTVIGRRYGKALFDAAKEQGTVEQTGSELKMVVELMQGNKQLKSFLDHPGVDHQSKVNVLTKALEGKISQLVLNAIQLVLDRGRVAILPSMLEAYSKTADDALKRAQATVYSPMKMSEQQVEEIAKQFGAITGKTIVVENVVDPSLLGGITVKIGDRLYDGSLSGKLKDLQKNLS